MNEAAGPSFLPFIMLLVFFLFIYFVTIRPQQKRQKEHEALVSSLEKGDEVMTSSGLIGGTSGFLGTKACQGCTRYRAQGTLEVDRIED